MVDNSRNLLLTITGPTAVGKTDIAIEIAQHLNTEIISCDSRQIYQEMSIGTAVPDNEQLAAIKHHFVQYQPVTEPVNANDFGNAVRLKLNQLFKKHPTVVMVGGSGLYIDSVLNGIDQIPSPAADIRLQLQQRIDNGELDNLKIELQRVDPAYFNSIDTNNPRRILRGLEVFLTSGKPISSFLGHSDKRLFKSAVIVVEMERNLLYNRVNSRVELMIERGLLTEVERLLPYKHLSSLQTVGYSELFDFFEGKVLLDQAVENIKSNTRKYVRKQENWFRRYDGAFRIISKERKQILKLINDLT